MFRHVKVRVTRVDTQRRLCTLAEATHLADTWRNAGQTIAWTNGCFDLLHPGHIDSIERAAGFADRLFVGVNEDASVQRLKGPGRPLLPFAARARIVAALAAVDAVVGFSEDTPLNAIMAIRPDVLVKGGDYDAASVVGGSEVRSWGGRVEIIPLTPGWSTTAIESRLRQG
ncbi:MAG: D-glycero-beta-D-manno-heptose 1-phosphate adenylyltransferase [Candidatus Dadabacteria bacterium]|nr:MAG: D-glycero-beta-D-manno-heptose 1-phosphate adenylyltransferase [Candidatus Dadabacteria bacterium]